MKYWTGLALLLACSIPGASAHAQNIDGKTWKIVELDGQKLDAAARAKTSVTFDKAAMRMAGTIGCNRISGVYEIDRTRLKFGPLMSTRMACPGELDQRERAFTAALEKAAGYQQIGSVFVIVDGDKKKLIQFTPE